MRKGQILTVIDPQGGQVSDLFCLDKDDPSNFFSASRSMDYADKIYLSEGDRLYSNRSDVLFTILEDTCGRHDLLMPPCSRRMFQIVAEDDTYEHPSCHQNLANALAQFDISPDVITSTFNIFMNVEVTTEGRLNILPPQSKAGDRIRLRAQRDLTVGLTACSHEPTNGGCCKRIDFRLD